MQIISSDNGFSPENIVRIRQGVPAQTERGPIETILDERQRDVLEGVASGFTLDKIGDLETLRERRRIQENRVSSILRESLSLIDVSQEHKIKLAAFYPVKIDDDILFGKDLSQLTETQLKLLEGLSQGLNFKEIAKEGIAKAPQQIQRRISKEWPEARGSQLRILRIANGLRAIRVAKAKISDPADLLHEDFSLDELAKI